MPQKKSKKKHIVVFQDAEGGVLKTTFVGDQEAAVPPEMPAKKGETAHHEIVFSGWDQTIDCVKGNLVVRPVYQKVPKNYLVMYLHEDGKLLGTETVPYGKAAKNPPTATKPQTPEYRYVFAGWNVDLSVVEKDTMAKAVFVERRRVFSVRFFHEDGTLLKEERVAYGRAAHPPAQVEKKADAVWHYAFSGWTREFSFITEDIDVHASFSAEYNLYKIAIFEEDSLLSEREYHYGDAIHYPELRRKGYTLLWDAHPKTVTEAIAIHARWEFSNPVGKVVWVDGNQYVITNPSIKNGAVCLLEYQTTERTVKLPARVFVGDYSYRIEEIGENAFAGCLAMRRLILPDSVRKVRERGLGGCVHLEEVSFGKKLHHIGKDAFKGSLRMRRTKFRGKELRRSG